MKMTLENMNEKESPYRLDSLKKLEFSISFPPLINRFLIQFPKVRKKIKGNWESIDGGKGFLFKKLNFY